MDLQPRLLQCGISLFEENMELFKKDVPIVVAFLNREADEFRWKCWFNKYIYIGRMLRLINGHLAKIEKANYIHIESLTNLGLIQRVLTLTPKQWDEKGAVRLMLPPNPHGRIGVSVTERL